MLKLRLTHKAFILILVPLFFELLFISTLAVLLNNAEAEAFAEARAKAVVAEANTISELYYVTASAMAAASVSRDPEALHFVDDKLQRIKDHIQILDELPAANEKQKEAIKEVEKTASRGLELLKTARNQIGAGSLALLVLRGNDVRYKLKGVYDDLMLALHRVAEEEFENVGSPTQHNSRFWVRQILMVGIALNIVLAVGLALAFVGSTRSRLLTLMQNAQRVAAKQPLAPLVGGSDEIAELDRVFHDMAKALDEAAEKEKHMNALKQRFIAMVGHDIRAPLTCIQGALEMLESGVYGELSANGTRQISTANESANRLMALVRDLLELDKLAEGKLSVNAIAQDASDLCQSAVNEMELLASNKEIKLATDYDEDCEVLADSDRIVQVLVNLISNAVKFSPTGGTITIRAHARETDALFEIEDQGRGIPAEKVDKLFKRYSQLEEDDAKILKGFGLGLNISKEIMEAHNGDIGCRSEVGKGTTFWFTLPLVRERVETEAEQGAPSAVSS